MYELDCRAGIGDPKPPALQNFSVAFSVQISKPFAEIQQFLINGELAKRTLAFFSYAGRKIIFIYREKPFHIGIFQGDRKSNV